MSQRFKTQHAKQQLRRHEVNYNDMRVSRDVTIDEWFNEVAQERDCIEDCPALENEELLGLTILEHPHITSAGSIVGMRI